MLEVTDAARSELRRIIQTRALPPGKYLKLAVKPEWTGPGDFGIVIDDEKGGEIFFESDGQPVLAVDPGLAENLERSVFYFKHTERGTGFTLDVY